MDQTEKLIIDIIDQHRDEVIEFARDIYTHAELGYKEFRTSQKFVNKMKELGLHTETGFAITGVKAYLNEEKKENACLALLGELDALRIPEHAYVNPETDAAHCCGHHAQMAGIFGAALALTVPEIAEKAGWTGSIFWPHLQKSMVRLNLRISCVSRARFAMEVENAN